MPLPQLLDASLHLVERLFCGVVDDSLAYREVVGVFDQLACALGTIGPDHLLGDDHLAICALEAALNPAHDGDGGVLLDRVVLATFDGLDDPVVNPLLMPNLGEQASRLIPLLLRRLGVFGGHL